MADFPGRQWPKRRSKLVSSSEPDGEAIKIDRAAQNDQKDALRFVWPLAKRHELGQPAINDRLTRGNPSGLDLKFPNLENPREYANVDKPSYKSSDTVLLWSSLWPKSCQRGMDGASRLRC